MKKGRLNGNYFSINPGPYCGIIVGGKLAENIYMAHFGHVEVEADHE